MANKTFMTGDGTFSGAGASGSFINNSATETALNSAANSVKNAIPTVKALKPPVPAGSKGDDIGASSTAFSNSASPSNKGIDLKFLPNILDNYDNYTYHWKLFMAPLPNAKSGAVLDQSVQTIIAESGVTDLTIDKVEIQGIVTPSAESGTGTMTTLKFEIVEPAGAGLLDKMFYESIALGIGNWMVTPYFIQLEFRGRDADSQDVVVQGGGGIGELRWCWPIQITSSKINVTHVGTRYEFDAVVYDELAQSNLYFSIQHNIVLNKLKTFGDAMKDLEDKLNQDCYEKLFTNYSIPDTYRIVVDPILAITPLVNPDQNKNTARASDYVDFSKKTAMFNTGTSVDKIVDSLLGSTSKYQEKMQDAPAPSATPRTVQSETSALKKMWRVVTESHPIAYDALRQDNAVAITIYVVEFEIGMLDANPTQTGEGPGATAAAKKRLNEYLSKKILRKKYNYIFTGLNDQIIKLDLDMNYSFAAASARFGGIWIDSAVSGERGVSQHDHQEQEKKAGKIVSEALQKLNNAKPDTNVDKIVNDAKAAIAATKVNKATADRTAILLENAKSPESRRAFSDRLQRTGGLSSGGKVGAYDENGKLIATRQTGSLASAVAGTPLKFIADVDQGSVAAKQVRQIADSTRKGKLRPIPFKETPQEGNFVGIDPASNAGRARTSSMFATALYSNLDASMLKLKMTIKGDPFWLFPRRINKGDKVLPYKTNMSDAVAIDEIKSSHKKEDSINVLGTDNFIIIRFRTPRTFNESTGVNEPYTDVDTYTGVYKVTRIYNKFEMGFFTQDIECILDPVINLTELPEFMAFLNSIEESVKVPDTELSPAAAVIPVTSIKQEKVAGNLNIPKGQDIVTALGPIGSIVKTFGQSVATQVSNVPNILPSGKVEFEKLKRGN